MAYVSLACEQREATTGNASAVRRLMFHRRHPCLQTLLLLFISVTSETKESFVSITNTLLVGTLIPTGEVSVSIAIF